MEKEEFNSLLEKAQLTKRICWNLRINQGSLNNWEVHKIYHIG